MRRTDSGTVRQIREMHTSGVGFKVILDTLGISYNTLRRYTSDLPRQLCGKKSLQHKFTKDQERLICQSYLEGNTGESIATQYGCCAWTVFNLLKQHNIPKRKVGDYEVSDTRRLASSRAAKKLWSDRRDHMLSCLKRISFKSHYVLEVRLSLPARRYLTKLALNRDGHMCVRCKSSRRLHIHHIFSLRERPDLALELDNCETLCNSCHCKEESWRKRVALKHEPEKTVIDWDQYLDKIVPM